MENKKNKLFTKDSRCFVVAEVSANHGQNFKRAVMMIKTAKKCGADAVKFQTYTPDTLTIDVNNKYFQITHPKWGGQTLYQLYKKAYTPWNWFAKLKKIADDFGILFFSTAFDKTSVDFLEDLNVPLHKISSFELVDLPLIEYMAKTKKPLMMSTGMATISEIKEAVSAAKAAGAKQIILLKCVSSYPAKSEEMNLQTIPHMRKLFNCPVGLSDHTLGIGASVAAVSLGSKIIERHFTLSRKIRTPDSFFSIEPDELRNLVEVIRVVEKSLGSIHYGFTSENIRSIRPADGLLPKYVKSILAKKAQIDIKRGTPLKWNLIE